MPNSNYKLNLARQAQESPPSWQGDLEDDCVARWGGMILRAEQLDDHIWWWAVSELSTGNEIDSSNHATEIVDSGGLARGSQSLQLVNG